MGSEMRFQSGSGHLHQVRCVVSQVYFDQLHSKGPCDQRFGGWSVLWRFANMFSVDDIALSVKQTPRKKTAAQRDGGTHSACEHRHPIDPPAPLSPLHWWQPCTTCDLCCFALTPEYRRWLRAEPALVLRLVCSPECALLWRDTHGADGRFQRAHHCYWARHQQAIRLEHHARERGW